MIFGLIRRAFSVVVLLLAAYAAVTIPIGTRTAYGHLVAIFTTEPARQAAHDIEDTGLKLGSRLMGRDAPARRDKARHSP